MSNNDGIGDINGTVEEALVQFILANNPAVVIGSNPPFPPPLQVYYGLENRETQDVENQDSSQRILPCVVCLCQRAPAMPVNFHGGFEPLASVQVISTRDKTSRADHRARAKAIFDLFLTPTIADDLSDAITDFHVGGVVIQEISYDLKFRTWVSQLDMLLRQVVCASIE